MSKIHWISKPSLILFCTLFVFSGSQAQTQAQDMESEIGNFSQQDVSLKECPFDKEADAVVINDFAISSYNDEHNLITQRRIKFKILKEKGIERGNIKIRYYSAKDFEFVSNISAAVLSQNDQGQMVKTELQPKNIYRKQLNNLTSEISFALPNIKVGSIVEYKYTSTMKHYGGLRDWYFQCDMPTMTSSYRLYILPNTEFAYTVYKAQQLSIDILPDAHSGSAFFQMKDIAGLRDEAYMASDRDYLQHVSFQLSGVNDYFGKKKIGTTWKDLAKELLEEKMFGGQLTKDLPNVDVLKATWAMETSPEEKVKKIYGYVRSNFVWNHVYSKFSDRGIKEVWEKKQGYSGDINLILINLLKAAELEVYPLLVSERQNGKVDTTYPYLDQFNKVVAYVVLENKKFILDATDTKTPAHLIPFDLLNTTGFVVDRKKSSLIKITDEKSKNLNIVQLTGSLTKDGVLQAYASVNNYDYAKIDKVVNCRSDKSKYEEALLKPYDNIKVDSFHVKGFEADSLPIQQELNLAYALNKSGDYYLLTYNLFTGFDHNPFIADNRFSNIDFGSRYSCIFKQSIFLPENFDAESLPKNTRMITPDKSMSVTREVKKNGNLLEVGLSINIDKPEFLAVEYDMVKGFYKKLFELLDEPVVLKAK